MLDVEIPVVLAILRHKAVGAGRVVEDFGNGPDDEPAAGGGAADGDRVAADGQKPERLAAVRRGRDDRADAGDVDGQIGGDDSALDGDEHPAVFGIVKSELLGAGLGRQVAAENFGHEVVQTAMAAGVDLRNVDQGDDMRHGKHFFAVVALNHRAFEGVVAGGDALQVDMVELRLQGRLLELLAVESVDAVKLAAVGTLPRPAEQVEGQPRIVQRDGVQQGRPRHQADFVLLGQNRRHAAAGQGAFADRFQFDLGKMNFALEMLGEQRRAVGLVRRLFRLEGVFQQLPAIRRLGEFPHALGADPAGVVHDDAAVAAFKAIGLDPDAHFIRLAGDQAQAMLPHRGHAVDLLGIAEDDSGGGIGPAGRVIADESLRIRIPELRKIQLFRLEIAIKNQILARRHGR